MSHSLVSWASCDAAPWQPEDALRESEEAATQLRGSTAGAGGADVVSVERFEVVVDETG
jgi:hypothetical protein